MDQSGVRATPTAFVNRLDSVKEEKNPRFINPTDSVNIMALYLVCHPVVCARQICLENPTRHHPPRAPPATRAHARPPTQLL